MNMLAYMKGNLYGTYMQKARQSSALAQWAYFSILLSTLLMSYSTFSAPSTSALHTHFSVFGKVAFKHGNKGGNASLDWQQEGESYIVYMYGPLGSESITLYGRPHHLKLLHSDGRQASANTPEALLYRELGYEIPVSGLQYWLRGIPAPGTFRKAVDAQGRLQRLEQNGWVIDYLAYMTYHSRSGKPISLPKKIELRHLNSPDGEETRLKFFFQKWSLF